MLDEELGDLGLDRLRQQGARSVAQHLGEQVSKRPWLKQLDDGSIGHGVSLLCWRRGGANTPTIRRLLPLSPSPTSANSSQPVAPRPRRSATESSLSATCRGSAAPRMRTTPSVRAPPRPCPKPGQSSST